MKNWLKFLPIVALLGLAAFWWLHPRSSVSGGSRYRTATVGRGDVTQTVTASGSLDAVTTVQVGSQVSGNVVKLYADYNDVVKAGQLIAEIEPSTYEARLVQAEGDLTSARATLELKQVGFQRNEALLKQRLISQADYDQARAEFRQQEAAVNIKEASLKSAQVDLSHTKIYSPIDGIVISRAIDVGQTVQASFSAPELFKIAQNLHQMQITANISEADIGNVEAGQSVTFTVDAFPGRTFQGEVRQVRNNSTISSNVVTYPTIITADNADLKLRPGMTANIVIATSRRTNVLRVPNAALRFRPPDGATVVADASAGSPPAFDQMPAEIRQRLLADFDRNGDGKLDDDERKIMETTLRNRIAASSSGGGFGPPFGGPPPGGGPGGPGGGSSATATRTSSPTGANSPQSVTLYVARSQPTTAGFATGELEAISVYTGASDSINTEILSGLSEGAFVVTGTVTAQQAAAATTGTNNIFGPPRPPGAGTRR